MKPPCDFDGNGECLLCDCWPSQCAFMRFIKQDYSYEGKEELEAMFKDIIVCPGCEQAQVHTYPMSGKLYCKSCNTLIDELDA